MFIKYIFRLIISYNNGECFRFSVKVIIPKINRKITYQFLSCVCSPVSMTSIRVDVCLSQFTVKWWYLSIWIFFFGILDTIKSSNNPVVHGFNLNNFWLLMFDHGRVTCWIITYSVLPWTKKFSGTLLPNDFF